MRKRIIMTGKSRMPASCKFGDYRNVAVVEIETDELPEGCEVPKMISERARGVKEIVKCWERLNVGATARCAYQRALAEARSMI